MPYLQLSENSSNGHKTSVAVFPRPPPTAQVVIRPKTTAGCRYSCTVDHQVAFLKTTIPRPRTRAQVCGRKTGRMGKKGESKRETVGLARGPKNLECRRRRAHVQKRRGEISIGGAKYIKTKFRDIR
ncbi:unnamed protein product, partial [Ectocarpus sp. 8 AP-2014]